MTTSPVKRRSHGATVTSAETGKQHSGTRIPAFIHDVIGRTRPRDLPGRVILYAGIWWLLTGGDSDAWAWGIPAVAAAALISPFPSLLFWRLSISGALGFIAVFAAFSLRSGLDVAGRALHPRRPLTPALLDYPWRLPDNGSRIFLANLINLMPGTLCVRITDEVMTVHTIGDTERALAGLRRLETLTARLLQQPVNHND